MRFSPRAALTALALTAVIAPGALAQNLMDVKVTEAGDSSVSKTLRLPVNKSAVIELGRPAADVIISNPAVADAFVQTSQRLILRGIQTGTTNAFIFDRSGNTIVNLEITVERDLSDLPDMIERLVPKARVEVEGVNGNIVLTGRVNSSAEADKVMRLVRGFAPDDDVQIVNLMSMDSSDQVMLQVRIVEMQRSVIKQLGIDLTNSTSFGELAAQTLQQVIRNGLPVYVDENGNDTFDPNAGAPRMGLAPTQPWANTGTINSTTNFNIAGGSLGGFSGGLGYQNYVGDQKQFSIGAAIDALERVGIVRTLAEPNITAVTGETANFLAGGEFPVPTGQSEDGMITIEFKQFGVGLAFTPLVLSEDRISLKVSTEVSELTSEGAFQGSSVAGVAADGTVVQQQTLTIPALKVRRAETTVELPSGKGMMIAGLIQADTRQTLDGIPTAKDIPIIGSLFRSRDFVNEETELVIIITPYLVDPANPKDMRTPADGFANASDTETSLFGKLNALYGTAGRKMDPKGYTAPVGFIED